MRLNYEEGVGPPMGGGGHAMSKPVVSAGHRWVRPTQHTLHEALMGVVVDAACRTNFEVPCTFSAHTHVSNS